MAGEQKKILRVMVLVLIAVAIWSAVRPVSLLIWLSEALFPLAAALLLTLTYKKFRFSTLTYCLIFVLSLFFFIGAHYSFTGLPLLLITIGPGLKRSVFDYICHFFAGLTFAFVAGELFSARARYLSPAYFYVTVSAVVMALAALWELIEWAACLASHDAFDMLKGIRWDTYWDMLFTFLGLLLALPFLSRRRENQG